MYPLTISLPFTSCLIMFLFSKKMGKKNSNMMICLTISMTWLMTTLILYECTLNEHYCHYTLWTWMHNNYAQCSIGLQFDFLSSSMLFTMTSMSLLIHLYSLSYMEHDPHITLFMNYLLLFTLFMIMLISSDNFLQLFVGWEGVGMCSYLLINYWHTRIQANKSAIKAMMMNQVGDIALLMSTLLMFKNFGSLKFSTINNLLLTDNMKNNPWMPILLLMGAMGKSSLMGLHTWLPDAMEGPTPVSALMHAATMVTAGMFLIMRSSPLFEESTNSLTLTCWMGSLTAFFAATMGVSQNDLKRIMAYSTCSQLGYMALAAGLSNYSMSLLHLMNHAFFKGLLFLGAGTMIHTMSNEQDLRKMNKNMMNIKMTYSSMLMGSLSLSGFPYLTGFFSKDLMLENSYKDTMLLYLSLMTAMLTTMYSTRMMLLAFLHKPKHINTNKKTKENKNISTTLPIFMLSMSSMSVGYFSYSILDTKMSNMWCTNTMKMLPLMCMSMGAMMILKMKHMYMYNTITYTLTTFSSNAWHFNQLMYSMLIKHSFKMGYTYTYKMAEQGLMEKLGPLWIKQNMMTWSKMMSNMQSNNMSKYLSTMMIFALSYSLVLTQSLSNSKSS